MGEEVLLSIAARIASSLANPFIFLSNEINASFKAVTINPGHILSKRQNLYLPLKQGTVSPNPLLSLPFIKSPKS